MNLTGYITAAVLAVTAYMMFSVMPAIAGGPLPCDFLNNCTINCPEYGGECFGTSGDDVIFGSDYDDIIYAGKGDDMICAYDGNDTVYAGQGCDSVSTRSGRDTVYGGWGIDLLIDESGNDYLDGGQCDDENYTEALIQMYALEEKATIILKIAKL